MNSYSLSDIEPRLTPSERMPVLFVGHGNPMNAISDNVYTREWARVGSELPEPQAIVVISAHWLTPGSTHITDAPRNKVIYDFGGFPDELYHVPYPTKGDAEVARFLALQLAEYEAQLDAQWGLDHGTWSVLKHLAPEPEMPVLQVSIDYTKPLPELFELYSRLRALRHRGVIFIGSGNIVHALNRVKWGGGIGVGLGRAVRHRHGRGAARTAHRPPARSVRHVGGGPHRGADRRPLPADGGGPESAGERRGHHVLQ